MIILPRGAREGGVEAIVALVVFLAEVVQQVEAIVFADATGILTTRWYSGLTFVFSEVVVRVRGSALKASVESIVTLVIGSTQVVDQIEGIGTTNAARILTARWKSSLTASLDEVEVRSTGAAQSLVDSTSAAVIACAEVVHKIEPIILSDTSRILATGRDSILTDSLLQVEVLLGVGTLERGVESISAAVVVFAQVIDQV